MGVDCRGCAPQGSQGLPHPHSSGLPRETRPRRPESGARAPQDPQWALGPEHQVAATSGACPPTRTRLAAGALPLSGPRAAPPISRPVVTPGGGGKKGRGSLHSPGHSAASALFSRDPWVRLLLAVKEGSRHCQGGPGGRRDPQRWNLIRDGQRGVKAHRGRGGAEVWPDDGSGSAGRRPP